MRYEQDFIFQGEARPSSGLSFQPFANCYYHERIDKGIMDERPFNMMFTDEEVTERARGKRFENYFVKTE